MSVEQRYIKPKRVRRARVEAGLSQSQLAHRIGAHFTSMSDWERGRNQPSSRYVAALARETGKSIEFFFGLDDKGNPDDEDEDSETAMRRVIAELIVRGEDDLAETLMEVVRRTVADEATRKVDA